METLKKIWRFFFPTWEVLDIEHYTDVSYGLSWASSRVVWKSSNGTIKAKTYYKMGHLTKKDLNGAHP